MHYCATCSVQLIILKHLEAKKCLYVLGLLLYKNHKVLLVETQLECNNNNNNNNNTLVLTREEMLSDWITTFETSRPAQLIDNSH
jgi:hypothetical protein